MFHFFLRLVTDKRFTAFLWKILKQRFTKVKLYAQSSHLHTSSRSVPFWKYDSEVREGREEKFWMIENALQYLMVQKKLKKQIESR